MDNPPRRLGLEWDCVLYSKLLLFLKSQQADSEDKIKQIINCDLKKLTSTVYPSYSNLKQYRNSVEHFIYSYMETIVHDCLSKYIIVF